MSSKIEWTEETWNPVTGCSKISDGCLNCYAERLSRRLHAMGQPKYARVFEVTCHPDTLQQPLSWKKPRLVFVNSMGDLFHEDVPDDFIFRVFNVMKQASTHTFQVLTKRGERLAALSDSLPWPDNIWMGVTVESDRYLSRVEHLKSSGASIKFLSLEPLLSSLTNLRLDGVDWVIVGGESGPGARPMKEEWATEIRDKCLSAKVPFFFKQWGGTNKKKAGKLLEGREWLQTPQYFCRT